MSEVVLAVQRLAKSYGSTLAVDHVSFELYRGETLTLGTAGTRRQRHQSLARRGGPELTER
jgi:ABC-type phosphonate transport system ATPase subunit